MPESAHTLDEMEPLLVEQLAYYSAIAANYEDYAIPGAGGSEIIAALDSFRPSGRVLELACGIGVWTELLLRHATSVTAVDASPEMLAIASARVRDERVRFIQADLFTWTPDRRYDVVFFGFWLSHVPPVRFFWSLVSDCLETDGRVFFVDDGYRTPDELIYGDSSSIIRRRLDDGTPYRAVKVPYEPKRLEERLQGLGWRITVTPTSGPFFWGLGWREVANTSWSTTTSQLGESPLWMGRRLARDKVRPGATPVMTFSRNTVLYNRAMRYNRGLDRDKDGIACEKK